MEPPVRHRPFNAPRAGLSIDVLGSAGRHSVRENDGKNERSLGRAVGAIHPVFARPVRPVPRLRVRPPARFGAFPACTLVAFAFRGRLEGVGRPWPVRRATSSMADPVLGGRGGTTRARTIFRWRPLVVHRSLEPHRPRGRIPAWRRPNVLVARWAFRLRLDAVARPARRRPHNLVFCTVH